MIVGDSFNYNNLDGVADIYFNFNNNANKSAVNINNDIKALIDFNINKVFLESINKYTDINNIYIISLSIIKKFLTLGYFKNINYRFIIINVLIINLEKILYLDSELIKDFTKEEKYYILYLQFKDKLKIINI